ncbi:MAG: hypothetical protein ABIR81_12240 [Ginsengibacter sp.]
MKKILTALLLLSVATFTTTAQVKRDHSKKSIARSNGEHKEMKHDLAKKLNLTSIQQTEMKAINEDFKTKMRSLKGTSAADAGFNARKKALVNERQQKIGALLTREQKTQMAEMKKEHRLKKGEDRKDDKAQAIKTNLGLTNDQVAKMKEQQNIFKSKAEAIKNNTSLTQQQKADQLKTLRSYKRDSFKSVLTPEQLKKLDAMHQHRNRSMKTS